MALKPILRLKIDELFMKWITDKAVQNSLNSSLSQILKGEIVTYATPQASNEAISVQLNYKRTQSPSRAIAANRPASPSTPPCSPPPSKVTASPRSPRSRHKKSITRGIKLQQSYSPWTNDHYWNCYGSEQQVVCNGSMIGTQSMDLLSNNNNISWDKSSTNSNTAAFWRKHQHRDMVSDTSLRSITPHIVRSRLTLFGNVLVDQKHALAIHNVHKKCTIHRSGGLSGSAGDCGSVHFGFCKAIEEQRQKDLDVKSHIERFESVTQSIIGDVNNNYNKIHKKQTVSQLYIPIIKKPAGKEKSRSPTTPTSPGLPHRYEKDKTAVSVSQSLVSEDGEASVKIPPFYFPLGRPAISATEEPDQTLKLAREYLKSSSADEKLQQDGMHAFAKAIGLPKYWGILLYNATGAKSLGYFSVQNFINVWQGITTVCHDDASRFMKLVAKPGKSWLEPEDLVPLVQDVVDSHPGLQFLQDAVDFHSRYIHCVISRIFYTVNTSWSGKIMISELRRSNLLQMILLLEEEDDINQITDYFSYEHFYVIYCKFWELDKDHDLFIDKDDLARHNDHALSSRIIDRIFSGAVTRIKQGGKMSYTEFVAFLLSEEDKKTDKSIEYWFRCMDLDGDGYISMYEMEYFYEEQMQRMEEMGIDPLPYYDLLCQMLDLVGPNAVDKISLSDLKTCKQAYIFFDTMFNLEKYLDHEQRDPFANTRDMEMEGPEPSDWDKFASEEYELLVAEENANEEQESFDYEDDFEGEGDDEIYPQQEAMKDPSPEATLQNAVSQNVTASQGRRDRPKSAKQPNSEPQDG